MNKRTVISKRPRPLCQTPIGVFIIIIIIIIIIRIIRIVVIRIMHLWRTCFMKELHTVI